MPLPSLPLTPHQKTTRHRVETQSYPRFGPAVGATERCTDLGNARRLSFSFGALLRHVGGKKGWLVYDGKRWITDAVAEVYQCAKDVVRSIVSEADELEDDERQKLMRHALASESASRIRGMVELAQSEPPIAAKLEDFDRDPMLFNCLNGTLDLRTGELRPHRRGDSITQLAGTAFDLNAKCPRFEGFLNRTFKGKQELISFMQRAIGYTLTGSVAEQVLFFLYGTGKNGKSTLLEVLRKVFGDFSQATSFSTLLANKNSSGPRNDIARLRGKRFVTAIEAGAGRTLDEPVVKQITGGDTIAERALYAEAVEFEPTHKLFLAANHKPVIRGTEEAIWRRIRLIPFDVEIPESERDPHLKEKLLEEAPGILAWAVRGCLEWQRDGLKAPAEVLAATASYRSEMDTVEPFFDARCVIEPRATVKAGELYSAYKAWAEQAGETPISQTVFGHRLNEKGYRMERSAAGKRRVGIRLRQDGELPGFADSFSPEEPEWVRS